MVNIKVKNCLISSATFSFSSSQLYTNSMQQSPSSESNRLSSSQEIPHILWDLKVHYHFYKFLLYAHVLSQIKPVHASPSHFLEIHLNIILPSPPGSSKLSLSLRFPHQNPLYTSLLTHSCYMLSQCHSSTFDHPNNIWSGVQITVGSMQVYY